MDVRLPSTLLREIVGDTFTHENVAGVAAIHHSLRDVDAYAGDVVAPVCILHMMDRAAVDSHPHRQTRPRAPLRCRAQSGSIPEAPLIVRRSAAWSSRQCP